MSVVCDFGGRLFWGVCFVLLLIVLGWCFGMVLLVCLYVLFLFWFVVFDCLLMIWLFVCCIGLICGVNWVIDWFECFVQKIPNILCVNVMFQVS